MTYAASRAVPANPPTISAIVLFIWFLEDEPDLLGICVLAVCVGGAAVVAGAEVVAVGGEGSGD